jgi:hypothetical protein
MRAVLYMVKEEEKRQKKGDTVTKIETKGYKGIQTEQHKVQLLLLLLLLLTPSESQRT